MRFLHSYRGLLSLISILTGACAQCISGGDDSTINSALSNGGEGTVVSLCPGATITIFNQISFTANNQEISTEGYPTDSTRATIIIGGGNLSRLIEGFGFSGATLRSIQVDGNEPNLGHIDNGSESIQLGGPSTGVLVANVASRNPRGWSCMQIIESGIDDNPCTNAQIINNDIGPCGHHKPDNSALGLWADGISFACTNSLIQGNTITGSTDGGIVLFGAPGTTVQSNRIISSSTEVGFGGINLVDYEVYGGSFAGVQVLNNHITGSLLFDIGIAIGSCVWWDHCYSTLTGPATISGNTLDGFISFPVAVNGWTGGLTVENNDASGVPGTTSFADAEPCPQAVQEMFYDSAKFTYYPPGLTGPTNLIDGFTPANGELINMICTTADQAPVQRTFSYGQLADQNGLTWGLHDGFDVVFQTDGNLVVYDRQNGQQSVEWSSAVSVDCSGGCDLYFQGDGNLVTYQGGNAIWSSGTGGSAAETLVFRNSAPWIFLIDGSGNLVWQA